MAQTKTPTRAKSETSIKHTSKSNAKSSKPVKPIPDGFTTITPHLVCRNAGKAIDFYKKAFGAQVLYRSDTPEGKVMHASLKIGDSIVMLADEFPDWGCFGPQHLGGSAVTIHLYVNDADAAFKKAVSAGAEATMPPNDAFWGDRYAKVTDPFGHLWSIATHIEDVTPKQMEERAAQWTESCGAAS